MTRPTDQNAQQGDLGERLSRGGMAAMEARQNAAEIIAQAWVRHSMEARTEPSDHDLANATASVDALRAAGFTVYNHARCGTSGGCAAPVIDFDPDICPAEASS